MNTNTVEQAERLKELGIGWVKWEDGKPYNNGVAYKNLPMPKFAKQLTDKVWASVRCMEGLYDAFDPVDTGDTQTFTGPALTLDDLHRVFEKLHKDGITDSRGEFERIEVIFDCYESPYEPLWFINPFADVFPRTKNHAEDWTAVLIWLLENNHVTAQAVNEALA